MTKQSWKILPKTKLGWWSVGLIIAAPILFILGGALANMLYESTPAGGTILAEVTARPVLALTMLAGIASGISACITGILAITRQKERGILVFVTSIISMLFTLLIGMVFLGPG